MALLRALVSLAVANAQDVFLGSNTVSLNATAGEFVTVINNCNGQLWYSDQSTYWRPALSSEYLYTSGTGIAVCVGYVQGQGTGTLAEFSFTDGYGVFFDVSLINGYNYPVAMNEVKCTNKGCTGHGVYPYCHDDGKGTACAGSGNALTITFCPDGPVNSTAEYCQ